MRKLLVSFTILLGYCSAAFGQSYEPGELLLQLKDNSEHRIVADKLMTIGGQDLVFFKPISKPLNIYHLKYNGPVNLDAIIKASFDIKEILTIQKNHLVEDRVTIPNDSLFTDQWHLNNTGQTGGNAGADIDAPEAWDVTTGGNTAHGDTIVVCIIESLGVDIDHVDLAENMWKNHAEIPNNGIDDDNNGYTDDFDGWNVGTNSGVITAGSHGTRVAGMVGAIGNNSIGVSGVNHTVKMMIVQGQVGSNEASVLSAYTYPLIMRQKYNATNGLEGAFVVVTNASWGINNGNPANSPLWCAFYDTLGANGIINIGATSNSNVNVDNVGDLPTTCPSDYLVSVTMTNSADFRAGSGYGAIHIDLAAPGSAVTLTNINDNYSTSGGTSFATPCVSGAVALLYAAPCADFISYAKTYPDSAVLRVRALLLDNVDNLSNLVGEVNSGGRLNVNNAIQALMNSCDTNACIAPYGLNLSSLTDTDVLLNWQSLNNTGFTIELSESPTPGSGITVNAANGTTSQFFTGLTPCTNYFLTLRGLCNTDTSNASAIISFTTDGCCTNPPLIIDSISETRIDLSWSPVLYATNYVIRYRATSGSAWFYDTTNATNTFITSLDTCTDYDVQVQTVCTDSTRGYSDTYTIRTKGCGICFEGEYCEINPATVNTQFEWIESITINGTTVTSGDNEGFYDGGIFGTGFAPGAAYNVTFEPGYSGTPFTERFRLWIDMDQNGVFDQSDQLISNLSNNGPVNGILFIPNTTITGVTKMRIAMNGTAVPTLCADEGGNIYGEYEDYCVFIGTTASISEFGEKQFTIFPNPTNDMITVDIASQITNVTISDLSGKLVLQALTPPANRLSLNHVETGIYIISFEADGQYYQQKIVKQ